MRLNRRLVYLGLALVCIVVGLLFRAPFLGLPREIAKYGGSILWAAMVFFGLRVLAPRWRVMTVAILAAVLVALGETAQLISLPGFDELRATTIGHLIFGRTFAIEDIFAYWI